ncbi:unnamed protein product [Heligmosomoides polygyrus]|uniref:G protein-coupled receptor n=1 Tax=Heligmosomoides polygyrus TaxID=6339 RepID=A0A183FQS6_HELPZ|nr:unnamed protein product [Heligmosomoides polygyrus]
MISWQTWLLTVVAAVTIPLYVRILYVLIGHGKKCRLTSHFYTVTISQGLIDIAGFIVYYSCASMRGFEALQPFYWSLNWTFFVQWSYVQTHLFEYGRILGIVMISIQRCSTVSFPFSRFNQVLISLPVWVFFAVHFLLPFALCAGMFSEKMFYDNPSTTNVVIDAEVLEVFYMRSALIPLTGIAICTLCYSLIIRTVKNNVVHTRRSESRLCIQMVGLLLALVFTSIHFSMQYIFNRLDMPQRVYTMRMYTPIWVGMLTFINPWMIILMNSELRRMTFCNNDLENHSLGSAVNPTSKASKNPSTKNLSRI